MQQNIVFGLSSQAWNMLTIEERKALLELHKRAIERLTASQQIDYAFYAASQQNKRVYAH